MKAALASSLAYRPELIILDEPFTGIDALVRDELIESTLEGAESATILIASHDLAEIESFVVDAGCLPTSAAVNPALTVAAVALRAAQTIKREELAA